jgi:hypothetical protein
MIRELELILMMVSYGDIMLFERGVLSLVFIVLCYVELALEREQLAG